MRGRSNTLRLGAGMAAICLLASCGEDRGLEPPAIRYGVDPCAQCGMIVSDERFAAAVIVETARGRHEAHAFDDIGCMMDYAAPDHDRIVAHYVHDVEAPGWIDAETAWFLRSDQLHTPMAFGLASTGSRADAEALRERYPGDVLDFTGLRASHRSDSLATPSLDSKPAAENDPEK